MTISGKEAFTYYFATLPSSVAAEKKPEVLQNINAVFALVSKGGREKITFQGKELYARDLSSKEIGLFTKYVKQFVKNERLDILDAGELQKHLHKGSKRINSDVLYEIEKELLINEKIEFPYLPGSGFELLALGQIKVVLSLQTASLRDIPAKKMLWLAGFVGVFSIVALAALSLPIGVSYSISFLGGVLLGNVICYDDVCRNLRNDEKVWVDNANLLHQLVALYLNSSFQKKLNQGEYKSKSYDLYKNYKVFLVLSLLFLQEDKLDKLFKKISTHVMGIDKRDDFLDSWKAALKWDEKLNDKTCRLKTSIKDYRSQLQMTEVDFLDVKAEIQSIIKGVEGFQAYMKENNLENPDFDLYVFYLVKTNFDREYEAYIKNPLEDIQKKALALSRLNTIVQDYNQLTKDKKVKPLDLPLEAKS